MFKLKYIFSILCLAILLSANGQTWEDVTKEGLKYYANREIDKALISFQKALKLAPDKKGAMYAATLNNLGQAYKELEDFEKAEENFLGALELQEKLNGKTSIEYASILNNLGSLSKMRGKYEEAYKYYKDGYEIAKIIYKESDPRIAMYLNNLAGICLDLAKYEEAEPYFLQAINILKANNATSNLKYSNCLNNLAELYRRTGNYIKAEPLILEAVEIRKLISGETSFDYALSLHNLGVFYEQIGHFDQAEGFLLQSLDIFEKSAGTENEDYIQNLSSLGTLYSDMHNFEKAENLLLLATDKIKNIYNESPPMLAGILHNLGMVYTHMDSLEKAEVCYLTALELTQKFSGDHDKYYANELNSLGILYFKMHQYNNAESILLKSLELKESLFGKDNLELTSTLNSLGSVYQAIGDKEKSEQMYLRELSIMESGLDKSHPDFLICQINLATLYMQTRNYSKAISFIKAVVKSFENNITEVSSFMSGMELNKFISQKLVIQRVCESFERELYQEMAEITTTMYDFRLFMDGIQLRTASSLKQSIMSSNDTALVSTYERWMDYRSQISKQLSLPLNKRNLELENWEQEANRLEKVLMRGSQAFKLDQQNLSFKYSNVREHLQAKEIGVEFVSFRYYDGMKWTDSILYSAVLMRSNDSIPIYIPLFEERQLKALLSGDSLRTFANLLYADAQVRNVDHDITYGDSLYQLIWKPIEPYLQGVERVFYSPSGVLHNVALDAIPVGEGMVLSDKFKLDRLTALSKIVNADTSKFFPASIALFGGIQYDVDTTEMRMLAKGHQVNVGEEQFVFIDVSKTNRGIGGSSWNYLPGAKKEVESISELFKKNKITTDIYVEKNGTEEMFKSKDANNSPSIIHISTHGFFFSDNYNQSDNIGLNENMFSSSNDPLFRSGLIFSGANYTWKGNPPLQGVEDGILTAYEVSNLYLPNTKLVVMSACETGLGDVKGSEGVYGLQRAFKMAGVEYIIMTLWQVLDKETSDFMTLFYKNLLEKKSIPDSFKTTQDLMKNKYREEPYKWAGFVLVK